MAHSNPDDHPWRKHWKRSCWGYVRRKKGDKPWGHMPIPEDIDELPTGLSPTLAFGIVPTRQQVEEYMELDNVQERYSRMLERWGDLQFGTRYHDGNKRRDW